MKVIEGHLLTTVLVVKNMSYLTQLATLNMSLNIIIIIKLFIIKLFLA